MLNIVLLEPEIPANTGNIGRTCVATGSRLHLIEPLGFDISEKAVRRAGMDYWKEIDLYVYKNYEEFLLKNPGARPYMATTKGQTLYTEAAFEENAYLMFGKESAGIPEEILMRDKERCIRIPMLEEIRSLNLSNSVAIVTYEALRQQGFAHMQMQGELHRHSWSEVDCK
ncbi:MAG: tRNA (cytidine(34)-2'-O)-methyltransferase [Lachnospiraceae bacterium]|nr:tRNA (cytidine(34)-2'-O)-methyltransferase [Lachnospiraceae bacterium]